MKYDVIIIGAGPGGIFAAYELMQRKPELKVAVFEAGHALSKRHCPIDGEKIKFLPFNYYEMWAQKVLVCKELGKDVKQYSYLPLEGVNGIRSNDEDFVHFVVVGMSRMGLAMAIEVAHLAHYPNFVTNKKRTRITFIDSNMEQEKHFFMGRFKEMFSLARHRYVSDATPGIYDNTEIYPWADPFNKEKYKSYR